MTNKIYLHDNNDDVDDKRMNGYTTPYLEESVYELTSEQFIDKTFAETVLFNFLSNHRIKSTREFFDCEIEIIKKAFDDVNIFFIKYNTKEKIFKYLLKNYKMFFSINITSLQKYKLIEICDNIFLGKQIENKYLKIKTLLELYIAKEDKYCILNTNDKNLDNKLLIKNNKINYWINNYLFKLLKNELLEYNFDIFSDIIDKINTCFWLEELIGFSRFEIDKIKSDNIDGIKKILLKNTDKLYFIYKNNNCANKTIKSIKHKINSIINENYLQKFVADIYNNVINDLFTIKSKQHKINKKLLRIYTIKIN